MKPLSRRNVLVGAGGLAVAGMAFARPLIGEQRVEQQLRSRMTSFSFGDHVTQGLVSLEDNAPPPVIRLRQGQRAILDYTNGLEDYSTIHWHGIRLPNAMDGVPYLTQFPVAQHETFRYEYTPPDAGTYWYHPHCMTMEQMALGLTGVLIVDEEDDPGFDTDISLNLKDFRLDEDGSLLDFFTPRGAARGGTLGNVQTSNWQQDPVYDVAAGGMIRLRFVVTDTTRIHKLVFPDVAGQIIAWDGHPVDEAVPWPTMDDPLLLAPGQRVDVAIIAPSVAGQQLSFTSLIGQTPFTAARIRSTGQSLGRDARDIRPLPRNPFDEPDIASAQVHEISFDWTPDGDGINNGLCGSSEYVFWAINRAPWPGDAVPNSGPVVTMDLGKSYILRLRNESPNLHPIHLHGLVFKPLRSNQRHIPANYTDTIFLMKNEGYCRKVFS
jgi:FtsP/CotA-like multicopper oxidase with cupredoxin domain